MRSKIFIFFFVLCLIKFGQTGLALHPDASDPVYPGKCVFKSNNQILLINPEEEVTDRKNCIRLICGNNYQMQAATCGKAIYPEYCHLGEVDETKDYPDCCPRPVCQETKND